MSGRHKATLPKKTEAPAAAPASEVPPASEVAPASEVVPHEDDEDFGYRGPVRVHHGDSGFEVDGQLHGFFQPIDGSYHWYGRLAPDDRLGQLIAEGGRRVAVSVSVGDGDPVSARIGEQNPWGGRRITGTGTPPFA